MTTPKRTPRQKKSAKLPAAVELGHRGGIKGGKARAASLSGQRKAEIARKAAQTRWGKKSG
jgi:hypothetical protein